MSNQDLTEELILRLEEKGCQVRIVSAGHLNELQEGIETKHASGLFDEGLYREYLTGFSFKFPHAILDPQSMIAVAVPQSQTRVTFTWRGEPRAVTVPPTYVSHRETDRRVEHILSGILNAGGYHVVRATLPVKHLAVCSGLGDYGRNNLCYVPRMGSFHRLVAFCSNMPCLEDRWREPQLLSSCQRCRACVDSCPTGAIPTDRFLLRAERCLTFHNERSGEIPSWIDPSWHHCLVGCLACQRVCPRNAGFLERVDGDRIFSEEETRLILSREPQNRLPPETVRKLDELDLLEYLDVLPRNLNALFG